MASSPDSSPEKPSPRRGGPPSLRSVSSSSGGSIGPVDEPSLSEILALHLGEAGLTEGVCSDVCLIAFDQRFALHKIILVQSSYFSRLFSTTWDQSINLCHNIQFEDPSITLESFNLALSYLYGQEKSVKSALAKCSMTECCHVVAIANFLDLETLGRHAANGILSNLTIRTAPFIMSFFSQNTYCQSTQILNTCCLFLCIEGPRCLSLYLLTSIPVDLLLNVVLSDSFAARNEYDRCSFLISWYRIEVRALERAIQGTASLDFPVSRRASVPDNKERVTHSQRRVSSDSLAVADQDTAKLGAHVAFMEYEFAEREPRQTRINKIRAVFESEDILLCHLPKQQLFDLQDVRCPQTNKQLISQNKLQQALWDEVVLSQFVTTAPLSDTTLKAGAMIPRFRFTCTFTASEIASLQDLHCIYSSNPQFYAGSEWNICLKRKGRKLSVCLHRSLADPTSSSSAARYIDQRQLVRTHFRIQTQGRTELPSLLTYASAGDDFGPGQTWGWESRSLWKHVSSQSNQPRPIKFIVVIGLCTK